MSSFSTVACVEQLLTSEELTIFLCIHQVVQIMQISKTRSQSLPNF